MKNTRYLLLLLILTFSLIGKAQMTTLYEFGNNTNDSIEGNFIIGKVFSTSGGGWIDTTYSNGLGLNASFDIIGTGIAKLQLMKSLPNMALYSDLEFQIEYTVFPNTQELLLFTSQNTIVSTSQIPSDNLVSSNITSLATIPYTNISGDSILKIQMPVQGPDSVFLNINYIKISADTLTSPTSINEIKLDDFKVFSNANSIEIIPNNYTDSYKVHIYNSSGQEIYYSKKRNTSKISLSNEHGIYFIKIVSNNIVSTKKVFLY